MPRGARPARRGPGRPAPAARRAACVGRRGRACPPARAVRSSATSSREQRLAPFDQRRRSSAAAALLAAPARGRRPNTIGASDQRQRRIPAKMRPPEPFDGRPVSVNVRAPPGGDRRDRHAPSTCGRRACVPRARRCRGRWPRGRDLLVDDQRQRVRCRSASAARRRACRHGRAARNRRPLRWPCVRRRRAPSCERLGTMAPWTAMPWFCRTSTLRSFSCGCAPTKPGRQRDLERARTGVEHLVGGVLERQELEDLQGVLAHLHDDAAAGADRDRRRDQRCARAP